MRLNVDSVTLSLKYFEAKTIAKKLKMSKKIKSLKSANNPVVNTVFQ